MPTLLLIYIIHNLGVYLYTPLFFLGLKNEYQIAELVTCFDSYQYYFN